MDAIFYVLFGLGAMVWVALILRRVRKETSTVGVFEIAERDEAKRALIAHKLLTESLPLVGSRCFISAWQSAAKAGSTMRAKPGNGFELIWLTVRMLRARPKNLQR